jgi:hypothetical protein
MSSMSSMSTSGEGDDEATTVGQRGSDGDVPSRARRIRITPLVAGIVFLVMAAAFAFGDLDSIEDQIRVVWPGSMLAIGVGMLLGARQRPR